MTDSERRRPLRIPKSVRLFGTRVAVRVISEKEWRHEGAMGYFDPPTNEIHILRLKREQNEQTYLHELLHAILTGMGRDDLSSEEALVDVAAALLHQAFTTAE